MTDLVHACRLGLAQAPVMSLTRSLLTWQCLTNLTACRPDGSVQATHHVLNECLIDRGSSPSMVKTELFVDGHHITTVQARPFEHVCCRAECLSAHSYLMGDTCSVRCLLPTLQLRECLCRS